MRKYDFVPATRFLILAVSLTSFVASDVLAKLPMSAKNVGQATQPAASNANQSKAPAKTDSGAVVPPSADDASVYRIGVEDELQISVWHEAELSMPVQVRPDGMITMPLINDVPVVGMTTKELQAKLTEKLSAFVNEPQVTVIVKTIKSRKVFLVGQVAKPGPYMLVGKKTVLQIILEAGGLGPFAKSGSIVIVRTVNGQQSRLKFNYKKAIAAKGESEDIELIPGDMVIVP